MPEIEQLRSMAALVAARVGPWTVLVSVAELVEVVPRVAVRPLPGAPTGVLGVLVHRGHEAVAIDLRERFGVPSPVRLWDPFLVVRGAPRWALVVDAVEDVRALGGDARVVRTLPSERVAGLALYAGGEALLLDPARLLDEAEHERLSAALARLREEGGWG